MRHDIRVYRENYRLEESTLEIAKVSKLLLAIDSGNTQSFCEKTLDEILLKDKLIFVHFCLCYSFYDLSFFLQR